MKLPIFLLTVALAAPAAEDLGSLLAKARMARDVGAYVEALGAYDAMLFQVASHETALFERAQTLGWAGRYGEALSAFRQFREAFPGRALEADLRMAQVLAWQGSYGEAFRILDPWVRQEQRSAVLDQAAYLAWSGRLGESLDRLETWLKVHPDDLRAALDRARFRGWTGRLDAARRDYQDILAKDPAQSEARIGLARLALWTGDSPGARSAWEELEPGMRSTPEAQILLAQIEAASGEPATARERLIPLAQGGPAKRDARDLLWDLVDTEGPWVELRGTRTDTSESLRTEDVGVKVRMPLGQGYGELGLSRYQARLDSDQPQGTFLRAGGAYPFGTRLRIRAALEQFSDLGGESATGHALALSWRAMPRLSLSAGWNRNLLVYTPSAIAKRGSIDTVDLGANWASPEGLDVVDLGLGRGRTSAGSRRDSFSASYQRRVSWSGGEVRVGPLVRRFGYSETLPLGFFNPEDYRWAGLVGTLSTRHGRIYSASLDLRGGWQTVNHGDRQFSWGYGMNLQWNPAEGPVSLFAAYSWSEAGLPVVEPSEPSSYHERTFTFGLRARLLRGW